MPAPGASVRSGCPVVQVEQAVGGLVVEARAVVEDTDRDTVRAALGDDLDGAPGPPYLMALDSRLRMTCET